MVILHVCGRSYDTLEYIGDHWNALEFECTVVNCFRYFAMWSTGDHQEFSISKNTSYRLLCCYIDVKNKNTTLTAIMEVSIKLYY